MKFAGLNRPSNSLRFEAVAKELPSAPELVEREHAMSEIAVAASSSTNGVAIHAPPYPNMVWIPGGTFRMGSDVHYPEEAPVHRVAVDGFWMERTPVTNREFRKFINATGYVPGATLGLQPQDITIAEALKPLGYATGQFGKNHLGDRNEFLPTLHGFDEFFGNLYHLNAEEEPEHPDYPKDPAFKAKFGPRGVLKCKATDQDDATMDPRFGKVGKQTIEDTGPLTKKRMETVDDETSNAAIDFIKRQAQANKPFFCWWNATRMHLYTHVRPEYKGRSGLDEYMDGMLEHDGHVGNLLKALDDLGLADNTIVVYGTDNGPHMNAWPDGAMTPFRSEKNTNWEGAYRVPAMIRWPGRIRPGQVSNEIFAALDWFPTLLAAAGEPDIKNKLLTGYNSGGKTFEVHLDGYNQLPLLTGQQEKSARREFFYINDDAQLVSMRYENWKFVFCEQKVQGTAEIWAAPFVCRRVPKMFNLRLDPYERADVTSNTYYEWMTQRAFLFVPAQAIVGRFVETFRDFPPRQKPSSFSVDQVLAQMSAAHGG
jgi:arylsulfatase